MERGNGSYSNRTRRATAETVKLNLHLVLRARLPEGNIVSSGEAMPEIGFSARLIRAPTWANV
jgi:hypothetical protein